MKSSKNSRDRTIPAFELKTPARHVGEPVEIAGWLYNLRKSGKIVFPLLRDGTGTMQCVAVKANLREAVFEALKNSDAGVVVHRARQDPRRAARARRL